MYPRNGIILLNKLGFLGIAIILIEVIKNGGYGDVSRL